MLYCGKPPKEKYKKTGENTKKHDLFIYFSFGANGATSYTELTLNKRAYHVHLSRLFMLRETPKREKVLFQK